MTTTFAPDVSTMHPRIAQLAQLLMPMLNNPPAKPTSQDRQALVSLRQEIGWVVEHENLNLTDRDETDRQYLYVEATRLANQQEDFYEKNCNKWEPMTKEQLRTMGGNASINEALRTFNVGNLASFAQKEVPAMRRALRIRTMGELNAKIHTEKLGAQELNCGNKTLEWIDFICCELGIGPDGTQK